MGNDTETQAILKIQKFEERYQCTLDELIDESVPPEKVPLALYQKVTRELEFREKLDHNPKLKAAQKIGIHKVLNAIKYRSSHDEEGRTLLNLEDIGERMGMSGSTASRLIASCQTQLPDLFDIAEPEYKRPDGSKGTRVYAKIRSLEAFKDPDKIEPLNYRKQGGDKYICPFCGSKHVKIKHVTVRTLVCDDCNQESKPLDDKPRITWSHPNESYQAEQAEATCFQGVDQDASFLKPDSPPIGCMGDSAEQAEATCFQGVDQDANEEGLLTFQTPECEPYCQPGQNGQAPDKQDAFDNEKGTHTLQIPDGEQNGSFCQPRQDDQVPGQEKQVAFAHQRDGVCLAEVIHAHGVHQTDTLDTAITTNDSIPDSDLAQTEDIDAGIGGLSGFPSSGIDTKPQDAFLTAPVANRSSALGVSTTADPLPGDLNKAAELLLALAGPTPEHIEMPKTGKAKYYTIKRPLTLVDTLSHLQGGKARGALCCYPDNQTHGMCWDTDDTGEDDGWLGLQEAMRALADNGYVPILEPSPAGRGGHSWIVFDDLVDAGQARAHVLSLAPTLATFKEYWPGPKGSEPRWNKVRLPGGRYVRPGVNAWCQLVSVSDGEMSLNGLESARLLLQHLTPTSIVPDVTPRQIDEQTPGANFVDAIKVTEEMHDHFIDANNKIVGSRREEATPTSLSRAEVDQAWLARYDTPDGKRLWFAFTSRYVAAWYNEHHSVEDLLPNEDNGYGLASWRGERTASVKKRGEQWTDFGASARRDDGSPDGGDALDLQVRVSQAPKPQVLRQAARDLVQYARIDLERAARAGTPIPDWLDGIITPAGYRHYARLAEQAGHLEQAKEARALAARIEQAEAQAASDDPENFGVQTHGVSAPHQSDVSQSAPLDGDHRGMAKVRFEIAVKDAGSTPATGTFPDTPRRGGLSGFSSNPIENPRKTPTGTTSAAGTTDAHEGTVPPHSQAESVSHALVECYHLQHGEPCSKCACELYRDLDGGLQCCRCYPPKGYSQYKNTIDRLYPRKRRL